jgi:predicted negative regulator of RcsB-dependent stress response
VSQHISRKELKQDRFAQAVTHGVEEVATHQKQVWLLAGAAVAVLLAVFGWRFWSDRQSAKAQLALDDAMKVYNARIRLPGEPPAEPGEISYVDEKNKFTDAARKFEQVAKDYGNSRPARLARYYAGLSYAGMSNNDEAQKWLRQVEGSSDEELASLARLRLAEVMAGLGKGEDAVKLYQALIAKPTTMVPKPVAMMALAEHYRKSNPAEAIKLYNEIKTEFKGSSLANDAEDRLQEMQAKS